MRHIVSSHYLTDARFRASTGLTENLSSAKFKLLKAWQLKGSIGKRPDWRRSPRKLLLATRAEALPAKRILATIQPRALSREGTDQADPCCVP